MVNPSDFEILQSFLESIACRSGYVQRYGRHTWYARNAAFSRTTGKIVRWYDVPMSREVQDALARVFVGVAAYDVAIGTESGRYWIRISDHKTKSNSLEKGIEKAVRQAQASEERRRKVKDLMKTMRSWHTGRQLTDDEVVEAMKTMLTVMREHLTNTESTENVSDVLRIAFEQFDSYFAMAAI